MALISTAAVGQEDDFTIIYKEEFMLEENGESDELSVQPRPLTDISGEVKIPTRMKFCGKDYNLYPYRDFYSFRENVTSFRVEEDNPYYATVDGIIYSKDMKELIACPKGKKGKVTIPNTVREIGISAFSGMKSLTELHIPASVTVSKDLNLGITRCPKLKKITVDEDNPAFTSVDGNLYSKDGTKLIACAEGKKGDVSIANGVTARIANISLDNKNITEVTIPSTLKEIIWCFRNCENLTTVTFAQGADTINLRHSFCDCKNLARVVIPASVKAIYAQGNTFENCPNLRFEVDTDNSNYESVDGKLYRKGTKEQLFEYEPPKLLPEYDTPQYDTLFYGFRDIALKTLTYYPKDAQGEYTIPSDVEAIGQYSLPFQQCKGLTSLTIGESVKLIPVNCWDEYFNPFTGCDNLVNVTIKKKTPPSSGEPSAWCALLEDYDKAQKTSNATYYLVEGTSRAYIVRNGNYCYPFKGTNKNLTIYIPKGSREIYETLWGKRNFVEIDMPDAGE